MQQAWWKESVVYQIYPRSFMDSNADGIGDLQGIISKLDYLKWLGVDVIWLSPVYRSPNDDNGYDISDYQEIMNEFGTIRDWEQLRDGLHDRGMKLMMDLVVNHTSDEHPWFVESRKSKESPYRDYYIWRDGKDGNEPNNWGSIFSGSAWEYDVPSDQYYLHLFSKKQPDLNWENTSVREEIYKMMQWWIDKGVDGFRMDVINMISKDPELPDGEKQEDQTYGSGHLSFMNGPHVHEYLQEMNKSVLNNHDLITVGEIPGVSPELALLYIGSERQELQMLFQFEHMDLDSGSNGKWDLVPWSLFDFRKVMSKWQTGIQGRGWNSLYLNNHDQPRLVSRFGDDFRYRVESAKMLSTCLHMMQGTPFIYQGEEIGMTNVQFDSIEDYKDIETLNWFHDVTSKGMEIDEAMTSIFAKGRDNARTPMQWNTSDHAGFTSGTPWIRVNQNHDEINVESAIADEDSILHHYRKLIEARKTHSIIVYGEYELIQPNHMHIYGYIRKLDTQVLLVICNFAFHQADWNMPVYRAYSTKQLIIHNYPVDDNSDLGQIKLRPYECRVYLLDK